MNKENIEKFFCNICQGNTNHFIRGEHSSTDYYYTGALSVTRQCLIVECCGCENLALVKKVRYSEETDYYQDSGSGKEIMKRP